MAEGIQVFAPNGEAVMDGTIRVGRIIGYVDVPLYAWNVTSGKPAGYPGPWMGTVFHEDFPDSKIMVVPVINSALWVGAPAGTGSIYQMPEVTIDSGSFTWRYDYNKIVVMGDVVYWAFGGVRIYYGVY